MLQSGGCTYRISPISCSAARGSPTDPGRPSIRCAAKGVVVFSRPVNGLMGKSLLTMPAVTHAACWRCCTGFDTSSPSGFDVVAWWRKCPRSSFYWGSLLTPARSVICQLHRRPAYLMAFKHAHHVGIPPVTTGFSFSRLCDGQPHAQRVRPAYRPPTNLVDLWRRTYWKLKRLSIFTNRLSMVLPGMSPKTIPEGSVTCWRWRLSRP
jgi:hypothetical protein